MYNNWLDHGYNDNKFFSYPKQIERNERSIMRILKKTQINEWTFSLFLFVVSLTIVIAKLIFIYGEDIPSTFDNNLSLTNIKNHVYNVYNIPRELVIKKAYSNNQNVNETLLYSKQIDEYSKIVVQSTIIISKKYGWLMKAALSGLGILGFTWFIVYKDSNIPGINPPSPFSPSKRKLPDNSRIQMNYLIGVINGILIFIYMSFQ